MMNLPREKKRLRLRRLPGPVTYPFSLLPGQSEAHAHLPPMERTAEEGPGEGRSQSVARGAWRVSVVESLRGGDNDDDEGEKAGLRCVL